MSEDTNTENIPPGQGTPGRPMEPLPPQKVSIGMMIIGGLLMASIMVPFLFWRGTWFGRELTDQQMEQYFLEEDQPRHIQHALVQISDRISAGDPTVTEWYPEVRRLATQSSSPSEVRTTAAWVMGQDNTSEEFHATLTEMLNDPHPLVQRNAALALVRFDDDAGKPVILSMLRPFVLNASLGGKLFHRLEIGDSVNPGTMLARVVTGAETGTEASEPVEIRSPMPGELREWFAEDEATIEPGQPLLALAPADEQVWEALRALYLIGEQQDLTLINRIAGGAYDLPRSVRQQALLTADAIQQRMVEESDRNAEQGEKVAGETED